ncbi:PRKR-interacting protein 1 homolog [Neodiprion virginianus]|uniref:PRKR-interacting protein 1 homolog n=1 Tax=Neodiprion virginianus TaxID=2961670 RepID=UPI001EE747DE|nr:PRKR-interacting protein 1 homolog [Neodiprion virginianus]
MADGSKSSEKQVERPIVAKSAVDLQRLKLMKLMKNPDKPILLPERPKSKNTPTVPEFVRNVMGSSAGAGSGEFHVYRHLRRKEYSRQKFIQEKGKKELLDEEYHRKLEANKEAANDATAKRRAKRLKKKQRQRQKKKLKPSNPQNSQSDESEHSDTPADDSVPEENIVVKSYSVTPSMNRNSEKLDNGVDGNERKGSCETEVSTSKIESDNH